MEISYNRSKDELVNVMKSKGEKKGIKVIAYGSKTEISLDYEMYKNESIIPVTFKGDFFGDESLCTLKGRFVYGFYLYTMVIVAALLIVARFIASYVQNQMSNMVLCGLVTVLLIVVIIVVHIKSKPAKKIITDFLNDLNKK